ncbi:hypothetical protein J3B02_001812 [Coemansia erecta]|nr:hypothetical protein J3B02_001812 [Coemansia erecta]
MVYTRYIVGLTVAIPLLATMVDAGLSGCAKSIALQITNIYENGDTKFHYDYCENLHDGRGYTAGIVGFCTGTADAWEVVKQYHKLTGNSDAFSPLDKRLEQLAESGSDSTSGISNYCKTWGNLAKTDSRFRQAQDIIRDETYTDPSQKYADKLGLKFSISQAQLYDTGVQHGTGNDADGLGGLIKRTNNKFKSDASGNSGSTLNINGHKVDEIVWLKKFLDVRTDDLKHPREEENRGGNYWAQTVYRVKSYQYAIDKKQYTWDGSVQVLDNDGKPTTNGDTGFHYDYCENLGDGRGFTAGIAGFCTGTGDAWDVIQEYHKLSGDNDDFSSMDSTLEKLANDGSDSTSGIGNYCSLWKKLGKSDANFQKAQDNIRDQLYFDPSQKYAATLGLKLSITQGQLYDTGIQHGTGTDADGLGALIDDTNKSFTSDQAGDSGSTLTINGHQVDEILT